LEPGQPYEVCVGGAELVEDEMEELEPDTVVVVPRELDAVDVVA
jgi:hypothetical protein